MSEMEPTENYVYQPIGAIGFEHVPDPPIYGVSGPDVGPAIRQRSQKGMTKSEAEQIAARLNLEHGR